MPRRGAGAWRFPRAPAGVHGAVHAAARRWHVGVPATHRALEPVQGDGIARVSGSETTPTPGDGPVSRAVLRVLVCTPPSGAQR